MRSPNWLILGLCFSSESGADCEGEINAPKNWGLLPKAGEWMFGGQNSSMSHASFNIFDAKMSLYEMMMTLLSLLSQLAKIVNYSVFFINVFFIGFKQSQYEGTTVQV